MYKNNTLDKQTCPNSGGIAHIHGVLKDIGATHFLCKTTLRQRQQGKKLSIGSFIAGLKLFRPDSGEIEVKPGVFCIQTRNGATHKVSLSIIVW